MKMIVVIGAGPAGMTAALEASRSGNQVILLEKNTVTGRKLRITGSGRGNLTNLNVSASKYFTHRDQDVIQTVLDQIGPTDLIHYLHALGIFTWHTDDGWVYPVSNSAVNVTALLEARLVEAGVQLRLGTAVQDIRASGQEMQVITTKKEDIHCSVVILAAGGKAYPDLGSTGELFGILERLGHKVYPLEPGLAPMVTEMKAIHKLQGVRLDAGVSLWQKGGLVAETEGNIIFTNWGINGPGVMDISHWVNEYPQEQLYLQIDFIGKHFDEFSAFVNEQRQTNLNLAAVLGGLFPPKMAGFLLEKSGIPTDITLRRVSDDQLKNLFHISRHFRIDIKELKGFDQCQVSTGGISLADVDAQTMQSKGFAGLYFAGEILDVVGPCGGYNLHWAFATGILAGKGAVIQSGHVERSETSVRDSVNPLSI